MVVVKDEYMKSVDAGNHGVAINLVDGRTVNSSFEVAGVSGEEKPVDKPEDKPEEKPEEKPKTPNTGLSQYSTFYTSMITLSAIVVLKLKKKYN